jgi:hypothetical protein
VKATWTGRRNWYVESLFYAYYGPLPTIRDIPIPYSTWFMRRMWHPVGFGMPLDLRRLGE